MYPFPSDLVPDILCLLPVKKLVRFGCVSKAWNSLVDDPGFAKLHLDHSLKTNTNVKLFIDNRIEGDDKAYSVDFDSFDNLAQFPRPFTSEISRNRSRVIGYCNGLLAVYHRVKGIALWNPSTRKYRRLPPLDDAITSDHLTEPHLDWVDFYTIHGFGYDVTGNDYKIVKMLKSKTEKCFIVMVYSLKVNAWRRIKDCFDDIYIDSNDGVYVNNSLHWVFRIYGSIFALDLGTEEYYEIPIPEADRKLTEIKGCYYGCDARGCRNAAVLGGCLCVFRLFGVAHVECHIDLWVMKEYGNKESWTKILSVERNDWLINIFRTRAVAYSRNDDKILLDDGGLCEGNYYHGGRRPLWFNLEDKKNDVISILSAPQSFSTMIYVESLVSVN